MRISLVVLAFIIHLHFHLHMLLLPFSHSKAIVTHLPDFSGKLPFTLETGYVGVGKGEEVQLFYYFVESQRNPQDDPLLLYLTGGPGTSAIIPFFYQIGPLNFEYTNASRSDVKLEVNPYSWNKMANIIFIDLPVGTGFSYAKKWDQSSPNNDSLAVTHAHEFIRNWLIDHPTFLNNPLYITGISYMGLIIPRVVSKIYEGNERRIKLPELKIKGFLIVNPLTDKSIDFNSRVEFAYRAGLIEYELYEPAKEHCGGTYRNVDPNNTLCLNSLRLINECLDRINVNYILDPLCDAQDPKLICRDTIYAYSNIWGNKKSVRQALHIRNGTVDNFENRNASIRTLGKPDTKYYSHNIISSLAYYKHLATKNCHALIINGDHDMTFPYMGTKQWINSLKLRVKSQWKPWFIRTQVAGYEKTYSEANFSLTYATIKGAGHSVAIYKPEESLVVVETWLASRSY